jgi:diguanylate cyclase
MAAEQDWREKYREAVSKLAQDDARWAKTQNVLKLLIGRLCLAAQGRDDLLDEQLTRVSDSVRKQIDPAVLEGMIAPLSSAVQALDAKEAAAAATRTGSTGERKAATENGNNRADSTGTTGERKLATPVDQQKQPAASERSAWQSGGPASSAENGAAATGERKFPGASQPVAQAGNQAGATGERKAPSANQQSPVQQSATPANQGDDASASRSAASSTTAADAGAARGASSATAAAASPASAAGTSGTMPAATADAAQRAGDDAFGATAVLDRLSLLPDLKPVVNDLRSRRRDTLNIHEMAELLERVTRYATEQRAQVQREKLELENLVQQTASRLEEITSHLASELDERNAVREDTEQLNRSVTDEVEQLRVTAEGAPDLPTLRTSLGARLDAISSHLTDFRSREDTRIKTYRERVQHMRQRISVLERESRSLHESLREEQRMAMLDALTGIPNRAAYDDRIEQEFKRWKRFSRPVSILAWDIDRFKSINDAYGHKAGDKVLRVIGQHLARHVRDTDFVGRYGGEEFVMLLVGTGADEAKVVADKIRLELAALGFHFHDAPVAITASCGITEFSGADTPDTIFDRADRALYKAKQAGRNCCIIG